MKMNLRNLRKSVEGILQKKEKEIKILVIAENEYNEVIDFLETEFDSILREVFGEQEGSIESFIVNSYDKAIETIEKEKINGVIIDIFLQGKIEENPLGLVIAAKLHKLGVPFVFCSSWFRYSFILQWITEFIKAMEWPEIIDPIECYAQRMHQAKGKKDWSRALKKLLTLIK